MATSSLIPDSQFQQKTTVLIIDDSPLFRKGIATSLEETDRYHVIGQASNLEEARLLSSLQPKIIILPLNSENFDSIYFLSSMRKELPYSKAVLMLESNYNMTLLLDALRHGASGYLIKSIEEKDFIEQIDLCVEGGSPASYSVTAQIAQNIYSPNITKTDSDPSRTLTNRELDVLRCVGSGFSNYQIALFFDISLGTVKIHMKHVMKKLQKRSRLEIALLAREWGYMLSTEEVNALHAKEDAHKPTNNKKNTKKSKPLDATSDETLVSELEHFLN